MAHRLRNFLILALIWLGTGLPSAACLAGEPAADEHIWAVAQRRFIDLPTLAAHLAEYHYVLIGEEHDQASHHRIQARLISEVAQRGRKPVILMEMLAQDQEAALRAYLDRHPLDASGLGAAVGWERQGWPDWSIYQPVVQAALDAQLSVMPANLALVEVPEIARRGLTVLTADQPLSALLAQPLLPAAQARLDQALREGHCNLLPEAALPGMRLAQRARDAHMALRLRTAGQPGTILIAGNGHVRRDFGVPFYLRQIEPRAEVVSVGLLAVDRLPAAAELAREPVYQVYDYLWLTPRETTPDRCTQLKARWPLRAAAGS